MLLKKSSYILIILLSVPLAILAEISTSNNLTTPKEQCDLFRGEWIHDPSNPPYTNNTCNFISLNQNCLKNGRSDLSYLHWRWKPYGCDLRPFLLERFLVAMLDKKLGFVGDSLVRNQVESLVCILSQVEKPVYTELSTQSLKQWYFPAYNFTLTFIWSRHLLKSVDASANIVNLHLDVLDTNWTTQYRHFDYVQVSTGQWFGRPAIIFENNEVVGCHACQLANLTELGSLYPYRRALELSFRFIMADNAHTPRLVLYRSLTPGHFEHGPWYDGGNCNRTEPYKEGEFAGDEEDREMEMVSEQAFAENGDGRGMRYMDVYHLSLLRPDGHPDRYEPKKGPCDCLHWCVPGPVDTWNYLMMEMILRNDDDEDDDMDFI